MTPTERRLLIVLRFAPVPLSRSQLAEALWGDREDGGPECWDHAVGVHLSRIRRKAGLQIPWRGGRSNGAVWLSDADRRKLAEARP